MAEFSKQWCEINDDEMPYDFDIFEIFDTLPRDHYRSMICEGFGFIAIMRDENDRCLLAFRDDNGDIMWDDYDQFMDRYINRNSTFKI